MNRIILILLILGVVSFDSCKSDDLYSGDCFVPEVSVNYTINMNLPEYFQLQNLGEFLYLEGGNRGVFLVHNFDDVYYAVERTCTYKSDLECAKIFVDSLTLQLRCGAEVDTGFIQCCTSKYQFDSRVTEGPSRCNLKTYRINRNGNILYINN